MTLGELDLLVDVGKELFEDLKAQDVKVSLHSADRGVHNFMFLRGIDLTMATALTNRQEVRAAHDRIRNFIQDCNSNSAFAGNLEV